MGDFRAETIYFIMVDRFHDGDPSNTLGKDGEYDETHSNWWLYWGGDLQGIIDKLDYIQSVGATAIWITPVFAQFEGVITAGGHRMAPYHGYWARDFKRLDDHLVHKPEEVRVFAHDDTVFDKLVQALHRRGMKLVLDIVCNHSSPHLGGGHGKLYDDGRLIANFDGDKGNWYHHEGGVEDWSDLEQVQSRDLSGLADFNEETYAYRVYIKDAMRGWLDKGVDAFRVDTVKHMPLWFWQEFTGDMEVHRPELFMFGEWFQGGCYDPDSVEFASKSGMSIIDFSWRTAVISALAEQSAGGFKEVAAVIDQDPLFRDASDLVTFVDNHDLPRFLSISNDPDRFRLALLLTMTARGIPCIYYGSEQLLHCDENGGNDPYNRPMMESFEQTPLSRDLAILAAARKQSQALQKGGMRTKHLDADCYAFTRKYMYAACLVVVNRADDPCELHLGMLELPDGRYEELLGGPQLRVADARAHLTVPARGIVVYSDPGRFPKGKVVVDLQLNGISTAFGENIRVCGDAAELGAWDVHQAVPMEYIDAGTWATTLIFDESADHDIHYKFILQKGDAFKREPGRGHHRRVPVAGAGTVIWRDDWRE